MINDRRLDARSSHFKVGFENNFASVMSMNGPAKSSGKPNEVNNFESNKQKLAQCNIQMGTSLEASQQRLKQNMKTSN